MQQPATSIGGSQQGNIGGGSGAFNNAQISAQASWELDIFGVNRGAFEASKAQENATLASWHEARVSVAAETANAYFNQRFCSTQANVLEADVISRTETLRLTNIAVKAGFSAPANSHLAEASLADARQQRTAQMAVSYTHLDVYKRQLYNHPVECGGRISTVLSDGFCA